MNILYLLKKGERCGKSVSNTNAPQIPRIIEKVQFNLYKDQELFIISQP